MGRVGARCLKCNTDIWAYALALTPNRCTCGNLEVLMKDGDMVVGRPKGTPFILLKEQDNGKIIEVTPMDTTRAPSGEMNERHATRKREYDE
jgi:hypothetical protein